MAYRYIPLALRHSPTPRIEHFALLSGLDASIRGMLISTMPLVVYDALGDAQATSVVFFVAGIVALVMLHRNKPGRLAWPFGFPAPQGGLVPARPRVGPIAPDVPESGDQNVKTDT